MVHPKLLKLNTRGDWISLAVSVGAPMIAGQISGLACFRDVKGWYKRIRKPKWTPPDWVFGAVWPVLYLGQGVSSWLVWKNKGANRALPLGLYGAQLVLNLIWQPLMFRLHRPDIALVDSSAMLGLAVAATATMTRAAGIGGDKNAAAIVGTCMSVYSAWVAFATALTARIYKDNPNAHLIDDSSPVDEQVSKAVAGAKDVVKKAGQAAQERVERVDKKTT